MGQIPHERIVSDPEIMMGKPTIKGTRITVELILEELGEGLAVEDVLQAHPHFTKEQVLAALRFAADYVRNEDIAFGSPEAARRSRPMQEVLADECVHMGIVGALRDAGHEVMTIAPVTAARREVVLERATRERATLLTADKDFGKIAVARGAAASGVVLFRRSVADPAGAAARLLSRIQEHGTDLHELYAVVTPARARLRRLSAHRAAGR